ncbi:unnamed protein product [Rotaria socialis]|uniref:Mos1 transposase HTH domain-containing protein n=1 Tax=Rotaria socialis TaxID=392032 RepID=A0A821E013_9BILA|nr:unnamed protein product [Rotaria socialis]
MSEIPIHIGHCILYEFQLGNNASAAARNICAALGEGAVADRTCRDWFKRFREGDMSLEDRPKSGRPLESDIERLKDLIEGNPRLTTRDLSAMLGCNQSTIDRHLHEMGKVNKLETWVPHQLTSDNIQQRITICNSLLSKRNRQRFLQQIVSGYEKWVLYVNHTRKHQWVNPEDLPESEPKSDLHPKKANRPEKRKIRLLPDSAKPHVSKFSRQKLEEIGWEVLPHPPYLPDLAPSGYHLFRSFRNHLKFFEDDILDLPKRWEGRANQVRIQRKRRRNSCPDSSSIVWRGLLAPTIINETQTKLTEEEHQIFKLGLQFIYNDPKTASRRCATELTILKSKIEDGFFEKKVSPGRLVEQFIAELNIILQNVHNTPISNTYRQQKQ